MSCQRCSKQPLTKGNDTTYQKPTNQCALPYRNCRYMASYAVIGTYKINGRAHNKHFKVTLPWKYPVNCMCVTCSDGAIENRKIV